jgi:pimeloyl-ACP methyl ester carboxylesterase
VARARKLILASTACGVGSVPSPPLRLAAMVSPLRFYSRDLCTKMATVFYGDDDTELLREHMEIRARIPTSVRGFYVQMAAAATWSSLPWLHDLDLPALVIYGTADRAFPAVNGRLLARRLRQVRLEMVSGGSHMWLLQEPERSARMITEFLEL